MNEQAAILCAARDVWKAAQQALVWRDQAELYEQVRKFSPREFHALWTKNVTSGAMFDDLVRAAIKEAKT